MSSDLVRIIVPFSAPVPKGHEVGWVRLRHEEAERVADIVFDVTGGLLYCREEQRGLFQHASVGTDPLRVALAHDWKIIEQTMGRAAGASIATGNDGVTTCLFVDPTRTAPYR